MLSQFKNSLPSTFQLTTVKRATKISQAYQATTALCDAYPFTLRLITPHVTTPMLIFMHTICCDEIRFAH